MTEPEVVEWIRKNTPLEHLCEIGGWPDDATIHVDICSQTLDEWIVNIVFDEYILEMSECDLSRHSRCGKFSISFDTAGDPKGLRLLYPM